MEAADSTNTPLVSPTENALVDEGINVHAVASTEQDQQQQIYRDSSSGDNSLDEHEHDQDVSQDENYDDTEGKAPFPLLENLSTDIRGDLEASLEAALKVKGSFHFGKVYPDAPNPLLRLDDIGHVGFPLSDAEAKRIISHCEPVRLEPGEQTLSMDRKAWEIIASKVHFDSPQWNGFIAQSVAEVYTALGVDVAASQLRCEFYKFLLYDKGFHSVPHQSTENVDGTFATMIIILPSPFTGGETYLSHSGMATALDVAPFSLSSTSLISWYTGVTNEVKLIHSGNRLALAYNLVHTTNSPRPPIPDSSNCIAKLQYIFLAWQQNLDKSPDKIIYLLDHTYSEAEMRADALVGPDAHCVTVLQSLGVEYGFRLGLASVECSETGDVEGTPSEDEEEPDIWDRPRCRCYCHDDEEPPEPKEPEQVDPEDLEFADALDVEREMSISNLVDLEGRPLMSTVHYDDEDENQQEECIPKDLQAIVEGDAPDSQEYDDSHRVGKLTRWYRRSVLVIWPIAGEDYVIFGLTYQQSITKQIEASTSEIPTDHELELVESLLHLAQGNPSSEVSVLRTVCRAAARWRKLDLWLRAFDSCHGSKNAAQMGPAPFSSAIETFQSGILAVGLSIEQTLQNEPNNVDRFSLLNGLKPAVGGEKLAAFQQWIWTQRKALLASLRPLVVPDVVSVVDSAKLVGELSVVEEVVSQAKATAPIAVIVALFEELSKDIPDQLFTSEEGMVAKRRINTDLLGHIIRNTDYYAVPPTPPVQTDYSFHNSHHQKANISQKLAIQHMRECLQTENLDLTVFIADKLTSRTGLSTDVLQSRTTLVLVPLLPRLRELARTRGMAVATIPGVCVLYQRTVPLMLDMLKKKPLSDQDIELIFEAADMSGGLAFIAQSVVPKIRAICSDPQSIILFIRKLQAREAKSSAPPVGSLSVPTMVEQLVKGMVQHAPNAQTAGSYDTIELMDFSYEVGHPRLCGEILSRLFLNEPRQLTANHVSIVLAPSITPLMALLRRRGITPGTAPFASYIKKVVLGYLNLVLGTKPADMTASLATMRRISCTDRSCRDLVAFFTSSQESTMTLSHIGAAGVKHVEAELRRGGGAVLAQWKTVNTTPRSLKVVKMGPVHKHLLWEAQKLEAIHLIKRISLQEPVLLELFGSADYRRILQGLGVSGINAVIPATQKPVNPVAAPSAAHRSTTNPTTALRPAHVAGAALTPAAAYAPVLAASAPPAPAVVHQPTAASSSHVPPPAPPSPPRKRRKTEDVQVIDLTSP